MRKTIDLPVLMNLVYLIADTLDTFSSFDVTKIVRSRLPGHEILHEDIKKCVHAYVKANALTENDNGTYITYSKKPSTVAISILATTPTKNKNNNVYSVPHTQVAGGTLSHSNINSLLNNVNNVPKKQFAFLKSEGRLTIPENIQPWLKSTLKNPSIRKEKDRIVILEGPKPGFDPLNSVRFRTGFKTQSVQITQHDTWLEVKPA